MTNTKHDTNKFTLSNAVDVLIAQREAWEAGTYAASNAELYALLGHTLDLFLKVRRDASLSRAFNDLLDTYGVTHNSSTSLALKIVRLVFVGKGREKKIANRAFTYARVLIVAAEAGVTGEHLPKFICDNNGIDELRRQGTDGETEAQKAKRARDLAEAALVQSQSMADLPMTDDLQPVDGSCYSLALVRKNQDGTASIVFGTNNQTAVNTVLTIAGKAWKQQTAITAENVATKHDAEQRAENVERLAQELLASRFQPQAEISAPAQQAVPA